MPFVEAKPAIEHIQRLRNAGLSVVTIAALSGVSPSTLVPLAWPEGCQRKQLRIRKDTSDAILAAGLDYSRVPDSRMVPALGTVRRIRALCRMGWGMTWIGEELGISVNAVSRITRLAEKVTARRARQIADLYTRYGTTPGPSRIVAQRAAVAGWAGPMAWDDIDDPRETPKGVAGVAA